MSWRQIPSDFFELPFNYVALRVSSQVGLLVLYTREMTPVLSVRPVWIPDVAARAR